MEKQCSICDLYKELSDFPKNGKSLRTRCKSCHCKASMENYRNNRHKRIVNMRNYYEKNKEECLSMAKVYYLNNKVKCNIRNAKYQLLHKADLQEKKRIYNSKQRIINTQHKLRHTLRRRLSNALKKNFKAGSAVRDLGCSIEYLKAYLESRFLPGMTWENHGEWHIDHVIPLSYFDLTDRKQLIIACNFKNLQPLWATDNLLKGAKYGKVS